MSEYRRMLAWKAGKKSREADKPSTVCNRQRGTIFYDDWHDGWHHADEAAWRASHAARPAQSSPAMENKT